MKKPLDRNNQDEILIQIGSVTESIAQLNRKASKFQHEIDSMPRRLENLKFRKEKVKEKISKKQKYINELKADLEKLENKHGNRIIN